MSVPDTVPIIEVILYSQGFTQAMPLSRKIYIFFKLANEQLSLQRHYEFGLRSIKVQVPP